MLRQLSLGTRHDAGLQIDAGTGPTPILQHACSKPARSMYRHGAAPRRDWALAQDKIFRKNGPVLKTVEAGNEKFTRQEGLGALEEKIRSGALKPVTYPVACS